MNLLRPATAEFVGTFGLVFVGGGAIIAGGSLVEVALAHGLILGVMVAATIHISGGQFNPAVSIALASIKAQPIKQAGVFIVAQLLGAIFAAFMLQTLFSAAYDVFNENINLGTPGGNLTSGEASAIPAAIGLEIIATFFLMFVIMGVAVDSKSKDAGTKIAGLLIGLTITADILCIGPLTGASMNPARSFGPALMSGTWVSHWIYWVAPIIGALLAALVYKTCFGTENPKVEK